MKRTYVLQKLKKTKQKVLKVDDPSQPVDGSFRGLDQIPEVRIECNFGKNISDHHFVFAKSFRPGFIYQEIHKLVQDLVKKDPRISL